MKKFNFFSDSKTNIRVRKFDMQDESDVMMYERINQKVKVDKENGWQIHDEDKFSDKHSNIYILLKWEEPDIDYEQNE